MTHFDVIIIGGGVGGATAAFNLVARGFKVAIVEERDWGGVTINRGSTPKKALLAGAETHYRLRQLQPDLGQLDWSALAAHSAQVVTAANQNFGNNLSKSGVTTIEGHADFVDTQTVTVHGQLYQADRFIIATGARPRMLEFPGSQYLQHSASFLRSAVLPAHITIIGAGIIAFALASIATEAGAQVTIIQHNQRALGIFDRSFVKLLIQRLTTAGVDFQFDSQITQVTPIDSANYSVTTNQGRKFTTNALFCVAGRIPNVEDLNLQAVGVTTSAHGIKVNEQLQTSNSNIMALGDCCDAPVPKLSNYATFQGKYLGQRLFATEQFPIEYPVPALAVFSIPKLGQVGVSVQQAEGDPNLTVQTIDLHDWQTYARNGDTLASLKLVVNSVSEQVVGAESIGQDADQLINFLALLITQKISAHDLEQQLFAYPTQASDLYGIWRSK